MDNPSWLNFTYANPVTEAQKSFNAMQAQAPGRGFQYAAGSGATQNTFGGNTTWGMGNGQGLEELGAALQNQGGLDPATVAHIKGLFGSTGGTSEAEARALGVDPSLGGNRWSVQNGQLMQQDMSMNPQGQIDPSTAKWTTLGSLMNGGTAPNLGARGENGIESQGWLNDLNKVPNGTWDTQPLGPGQTPAVPPVNAGTPTQSPPPGAYIPGNENMFQPAVMPGTQEAQAWPSMSPIGGDQGPITQQTNPNGLGANNQTSNDYNYDPSKYLNPSMDWEMQQGLRGLGSTASAKGQTFSGNTLKDIMGYSQGLARTNYNNAAQTAAQQQQFARGVDTSNVGMNQAQQGIDNNLAQYNQGFQYQKQLNDQTIPFDQAYKQAQLGLQGTGQQSNLAATLATLLSANAQGAGAAQGAGTVGANNSLTSAISQILASLTSGNIVNKVIPQGG
jgi:hypothetical protein